ncbi:MAG: PAS domain-containing protein [Rhodothalassiaceae bacterium]
MGKDRFLFGPPVTRLEGDALRTFLSMFGSEALHDFFRLWRALVRDGRVPARSEMTPHYLRAHLPAMGIIERILPADEVQIRLMGTRLTDLLGREGRGRLLRELMPRANAAEMMTRVWQPFFEGVVPRLDIGSLHMLGRSHLRYRTLHLPVADGEGRVRFSYFRAVTNIDADAGFGDDADRL